MIYICVLHHTVVFDPSHRSSAVPFVASTKTMEDNQAETWNTAAAPRAAQKVLGSSLDLSMVAQPVLIRLG